jgi:hypothetical protein
MIKIYVFRLYCTCQKKKKIQFCEIYGHCLVVFVKVNWREFLFFKLMDSC